ncbi:hypothetical protein SERLA73DRAFT_181048 [Serpula lacrymans var. lacrymans S7.3]|uniref:Uncharacterized protein n=1 Tax=Serpula lacrymans var. lacrymans (strain S7.3) TaxID=936435 RepID=F8PUN8_SERL3|nr:hypothetical protein SERLA73DRAFT_181048 [Serpula lacrymans var. lacrymans S7.3]
MVVLSSTVRRHTWPELQTSVDRRDSSGSNSTCEEPNCPWSPIQTATPIIVGVGCLLLFFLFCIWRHSRKHPHDFQASLSQSWLAKKIRKLFFYKRIRRVRVRPDSQPGTIDTFGDGSRSESTTPLDERRMHHDSFPSPKTDNDARRSWWNFIWKKPTRVVSGVPGNGFYIESDMGSQASHGYASTEGHGSSQETSSWTMISSNHNYDQDKDAGTEDDPRVLLIGQDFSTVESSPVSERQDGDVRAVDTPASRSTTPTPAHLGLRTQNTTPKPVTPPTPPSSPPMYSHSMLRPAFHSGNASSETIIHPSRSDPTMLFPAAVRAAGYPNQQVYQQHHRQPSTDSMLAMSSPMTPSSGIY